MTRVGSQDTALPGEADSRPASPYDTVASPSHCVLQEMVREVKANVDASRRGTGFGFSMPMHRPSRASTLAGAPRQSTAQMHRRMRASVTAERAILAMNNRTSMVVEDLEAEGGAAPGSTLETVVSGRDLLPLEAGGAARPPLVPPSSQVAPE